LDRVSPSDGVVKESPMKKRMLPMTPSTPCVLFTLPFTRGPYGYGRLFNGTVYVGRAHRLVWQDAHGPIPEGLCVLHKCDNPPCVRLDHLFLGTRADNTLDCMLKGRNTLGRRQARCGRGHLMRGANLQISPRGRWHCRTCHAAWRRARYERFLSNTTPAERRTIWREKDAHARTS